MEKLPTADDYKVDKNTFLELKRYFTGQIATEVDNDLLFYIDRDASDSISESSEEVFDEENLRGTWNIFKNMFKNHLNRIQQIILIELVKIWLKNPQFIIRLPVEFSTYRPDLQEIKLPPEFLQVFGKSEANKVGVFYFEKLYPYHATEAAYKSMVINLMMKMQKIFKFVQIEQAFQIKNEKQTSPKKEKKPELKEANSTAEEVNRIIKLGREAVSSELKIKFLFVKETNEIIPLTGKDILPITENNVNSFILGKWIPASLRNVLTRVKVKGIYYYRIRINAMFKLLSREDYSFVVSEAIRTAFPEFKFEGEINEQ